MRTEYKVTKPFGCAKVGDIFKLNLDSLDGFDEAEYEMEDVKITDKSTNSRYMAITVEYIENLLNGGNLKEWGEEIEEVTDEECETEENAELPSVAELKIMALDAFLNDCTKKYTDKLDKIQSDYEAGKLQPCVKVEAETVNYNLLKFIKALKQILEVDKSNDE